MKVVIIEDEHIAAKALESLIKEIVPEAQVVAVLQSIDESVEWFSGGAEANIVFMDIHLADGSSFSIFNEVDISIPIVFTTAYDKYALKAFEVNSVDYLLKPINKNDLIRAINKYRGFTERSADGVYHPSFLNSNLINKVVESMRAKGGQYKSSLLVAFRDRLIPLPVTEIAYIYIHERIVRAYTFSNEEHILEQTIEQLAGMLDPSLFFRANRQFIVCRKAVRDMSAWFGGRLSVNLTRPTPERIYISKARATTFKEWITG